MSYFYSPDKNEVVRSVESLIDTLDKFIAAEAKEISSDERFLVEETGMISCPPHFIQLIQANKSLRTLLNNVLEKESFSSLLDKE